ncbi:MAG: asparagine synthase (glutamine-hydrolyzing) [Nitrososphaerales archaeon]
MCGIGGCLGIEATSDLIRKMSALIKHRGPDDYGEYVDKGAALFSNRLSIIDLDGGHQPIFNEDENLLIVFNGEIYNFPELRQDLEQKGHHFKTRTDTEVILHGFEQYATQIFSMLDGMFAIAFLDIKRNRIVLARDRVGIKPLYFVRAQNGDLVFCSEIKGLLAHEGVIPRVNSEALYYLVSLYYVPFEFTLFSGISKIPPGHYFDSDSGRVLPYWTPPIVKLNFSPDVSLVREALEESVKRQLISDVEVGSFLSGGLDTSTIVAFASKHHPNTLKTFCMGFGQDDDELNDARVVADYFGTEHHDFTITDRSTLELYPEMIWHSEQPKLNTYSWFVNQFARKYVKVCLSGLGGDEILFGYPTTTRFVTFQRAQKIMKIPGSSLLSAFATGKKKQVLSNVKNRALTYLTTVSPIFGTLDQGIFARAITPYKKNLETRIDKSFFSNGDDFVEQAIYAEFSTKLPDDFLSIDDAMSMAHSLENRVPLLDNQLIDLFLPVPYRFNYVNGEGKALLRKAMVGILPEECFKKPKQGFSLNILNWWSGELGEEIRKIVSESSTVKEYFNVDEIKNLIPFAKDSYSTVSLLWHIYAFHVWHELFVERGKERIKSAPSVRKPTM